MAIKTNRVDFRLLKKYIATLLILFLMISIFALIFKEFPLNPLFMGLFLKMNAVLFASMNPAFTTMISLGAITLLLIMVAPLIKLAINAIKHQMSRQIVSVESHTSMDIRTSKNQSEVDRKLLESENDNFCTMIILRALEKLKTDYISLIDTQKNEKAKEISDKLNSMWDDYEGNPEISKKLQTVFEACRLNIPANRANKTTLPFFKPPKLDISGSTINFDEYEL
jgi:hypothetical protein